MKWSLFLIPIILLLACNRTKEDISEFDQSIIPAKEKEDSTKITYRTSIEFPYETETDSGYFKGYPVEQVDDSNIKENSALSRFLQNNLFNKDILILNKQTLSNSVYIDQKTKTRFDTLKNDQVTIVSIYKFGKQESQTIKINGTVASYYKWNGNEDTREVIYSLVGNSFRHISYKGKEFYYMEAGEMDCHGGSACLVRYHLLYDIAKRSLSPFSTFRVDDNCFYGDVNRDGLLDFLEIDNEGGMGLNDPNNFIIRIYSCNKSGNFKLLKDAQEREYYIEGNSGDDFYVGDSMNIEKYYWPVKLNKFN